MTRSRLTPFGLIVAAMAVVACQPSDGPLEATTVDLGEFYGHGRLQLTSAASDALIDYWERRRPGVFAASVNSGTHAHRSCGGGGCTAEDAEQVIEDCNRSIVIARNTCALLVVGREVVWRGQVIDPWRRQPGLESHNRLLAQPLFVEFPGQSEVVGTTVYIDSSQPIGLFTVEPDGFGGFCQGSYDFLSANNRIWDIRCNDGFEASGSFVSEDLASGGGGIGTDSAGREVTLTLLARDFGPSSSL